VRPLDCHQSQMRKRTREHTTPSSGIAMLSFFHILFFLDPSSRRCRPGYMACLLLSFQLPRCGVSQLDPLDGTKVVVKLIITANLSSANEINCGPHTFPPFTRSSELCSEQRKNAATAFVASDDAGNFFAGGGSILCKYTQDEILDWSAMQGSRFQQHRGCAPLQQTHCCFWCRG